MTNHPNRNHYARMLSKLDRISVDGNIAADCRRLANAESQQMRSAQTGLLSWRLSASAAQAERESNMATALRSAERFISAWGL